MLVVAAEEVETETDASEDDGVTAVPGALATLLVPKNENDGTEEGAAPTGAIPMRLEVDTADADVPVANTGTGAALAPLLFDAPNENDG